MVFIGLSTISQRHTEKLLKLKGSNKGGDTVVRCPCKGCIDRHFNCHTRCKLYEDFKIARAAENDFLREQNQNTISESNVRTRWRNMRLNKRKYVVNK